MSTRADDMAFPDDGSYGLTKREYFAALAMQGILASWPVRLGIDVNYTASQAQIAADALIAALNEEPRQ